MATTELRLGFVGLGLMGSAMVPRLIDAGHRLTLWNRTADKATDFVKLGARLAGSPSEVSRDTDIIQICVSDDKAVEEIVFGKGGVAESGSPEKILVDHSTISASTTKLFADRLRKQTGMRWVDAPVTGGTMGAKQGTLVIFAGGEEADIAAVTPGMKNLSRRFIRMGGQGAGQATKAVNQMAVVSLYCILSEMFTMARSQGIDYKNLPAALEGGFGDSKIMQTLGPKMAAADYTPTGRVKTMIKDMRILEDMAASGTVPIPMIGLAMQLYRLHFWTGAGDLDVTSVIRLYEDVGTFESAL